MDILLLDAGQDCKGVVKVLRQLRPHLSNDALSEQIKRQQQSGYQLAYVRDSENVVCVAGFVIQEKLAWGKHLYIDDLVTDENSQSHGYGQALLEWLKSYAIEQGCIQIHLDSGVQRFGAHKFYLKSGFEIRSHHFVHFLPSVS